MSMKRTSWGRIRCFPGTEPAFFADETHQWLVVPQQAPRQTCSRTRRQSRHSCRCPRHPWFAPRVPAMCPTVRCGPSVAGRWTRSWAEDPWGPASVRPVLERSQPSVTVSVGLQPGAGLDAIVDRHLSREPTPKTLIGRYPPERTAPASHRRCRQPVTRN